jgi:hypothetical protein
VFLAACGGSEALDQTHLDKVFMCGGTTQIEPAGMTCTCTYATGRDGNGNLVGEYLWVCVGPFIPDTVATH